MKRFAALAATLTFLVTGSPAGALPSYTKEATTFTNPRLNEVALIAGFRAAEHDGFDRIVIDVDGRRPNFTIQYVDSLSYDGSGDPVPLPGRRMLLIYFPGAWANTVDGSHTYDGPRLKRFDLPALRGVALTGDWEAHVSFGITARGKKGYRVFTLTNPSRVVIDLRH